MKIELTQDWELVNRVLNTPEMLAAVCPDGVAALDAKALDDGTRIFLKVQREEEGETLGVFVLQRKFPGVFEVHTCLTKECRGATAVRAGKLGVEWMFLNTEAVRLYSMCPDSNSASMHYAFAVGFRQAFHRAQLWQKGGKMEGATVVELTVQQWAYKNAGRFHALGKKLHDEVFAHRWEHHGEDPLHEGMVGLAMEMGRLQPAKAEEVYAVWATAAGYAPFKILGRQRNGGFLVDLREALAIYRPETRTMEIIKDYVCQ